MAHIVVAVNGDISRARKQAQAILDLDLSPESAQVTVLHVFVENPEGASVSQVGAAREIEDVLEPEGYSVQLAESSGNDPGVEIVSYAEEHDADIITVAGRKRSPAGKTLFGSTSQYVLLQADCPVLFSAV